MSSLAEAPRPVVYLLGRNARGRWVLRDTRGLAEAVFRDRHHAIHFALYETSRPGAVVETQEPLEMRALQ